MIGLRAQCERAARPAAGAHRRGAALIITLIISMVLVGMVLAYGRSMRVEMQAAANHQAAAEAEAVARGAVEVVLALADEAPVEGVEIGDGTYWIIRPNFDDDRAHAFGLHDEGGKINLNTANTEMLEKLPRMTNQLAAAAIDWRGGERGQSGPGGDGGGGLGGGGGGGGGEPGPGGDGDFGGGGNGGGLGGGGDTSGGGSGGGAGGGGGGNWGYTSLEEPYQNKGEPFESVGELLLVHGFTPIILFGEDGNLNGVLDASENDAGIDDEANLLPPPDDGDTTLDRGLWDFVTVHSREPGTNTGLGGTDEQAGEGGGDESGDAGRGGAGGTVNVNSAETSEIREALLNVLDEGRADEVASRIRATRPHRNLIDLMYNAQMEAGEFVLIEPVVTVGGGGGGAGGTALVNVNTAPREVLAALPGLDEADADALLGHREGQGIDSLEAATELAAEGGIMSSIAWVTQVLDREKAVAIGDHITTRSFVRSADIVAVNSTGRAFERVRVVIDFTDGEGRILAWQRLTHLGWPLPRQWRQQLRDGTDAAELEFDRTGVSGWR